eukprot:CAMPEP_0114478368 /NCGR_PEP_ID=MMETSP0104-20121206/15947_1 /TAXON_ID=37642 ORGANISM="Paraphysomonas imperforata, Strain PA2" /NCGR_SAMPLE_ID=MMETSP0104 /ASSEMBLY_ACC=CAM_ASM_000202 /LENGTH=59 /DNA_ID=CAMNT_0001653553 /DNA_START=214 /DNA_END=393 /DNA_ORIENTATION=+
MAHSELMRPMRRIRVVSEELNFSASAIAATPSVRMALTTSASVVSEEFCFNAAEIAMAH